MADKNTIKNWFKTGLKPTQAQFWATWDSFWHKDEKIPITAIDNIENILADKADAEALTYLQGVVNNIQLPSAISVLEKTKAEIDILISSNGLMPGTLYKITGVHPALYNDGVLPGTTIYLRALTNNALSKEGHGEFWNPKYNQAENGFGIWIPYSTWSISNIIGQFRTNDLVTANNGATGSLLGTVYSDYFNAISGDWHTATSITGIDGATAIITPNVKSYNVNSIVYWGGYAWRNVNGNVGADIDILSLNSEWVKLPFSSSYYNKVLDVVEYDYDNDWISRRLEVISGNDVIQTKLSSSQYSAISTFMFGNIFNPDGYLGIKENKITNSALSCINFRGSYIINNTLSNNSSMLSNIVIGQNSSIESNTLTNESRFDWNILINSSFAFNLLTNYTSICYNNFNYSGVSTCTVTNSSVTNNTFDNAGLTNSILFNNSEIKQSRFFSNKIRYADFNKGIINLGNYNYTFNGNLDYLTIDGGSIAGDLSAATLIYGDFAKTAYKRPDGVTKIRYYNDFDTMVIADLTD